MILAASYGGDYKHLFGRYIEGIKSPKQLKGASLLVLWGGEDISPALYGQTPKRAAAGATLSMRDKVETNLVLAAAKMEIPILGICRGAQLLCALGGGSLYQHVENHEGGHHVVIVDGKEYDTNSYHHQVMITTEDMQVLGYTPCRSLEKWTDSYLPDEDDSDEVEIVYFPKFKAIGVQGHPEWLSEGDDLVTLTKQLTEKFLNVSL